MKAKKKIMAIVLSMIMLMSSLSGTVTADTLVGITEMMSETQLETETAAETVYETEGVTASAENKESAEEQTAAGETISSEAESSSEETELKSETAVEESKSETETVSEKAETESASDETESEKSVSDETQTESACELVTEEMSEKNSEPVTETEAITEALTNDNKNVRAVFQAILDDYFAEIIPEDLQSEAAHDAILNAVLVMDQEMLDQCMEQTVAAMEVFEELSYEEAEYFIEAEPELYNAIMVSLADALAAVMSGEAAPMSLLPLEEYKVYLMLDKFSKEELENFPVIEMLKLLQDEDGNYIWNKENETATTVWKYEKDEESGVEDYQTYPIASDTTIDLYPDEITDSFQFEIIVGTGGQLNSENARYIVKACLADNFELDLELELFVEMEDSTRQEVVPTSCNFWISTVTANNGAEEIEELNYDFSFAGSMFESLKDQGSVYLNVKSELANNPRVRIEIYPVLIFGSAYITIKSPITDQILNQDMSGIGAGYPVSGERNTDETYMIETYVDGELYSSKYFCMRYWNWYPAHEGSIYVMQEGSKENVFSNLQSEFDYMSKITTLTFDLEQGYSASDEYYFNYDFVQQKNYGDGSKENWDAYVKKIVVGHYNSIEEAEEAGAKDVTSAVVRDGYLAHYGDDGMDFTVFKYYAASQSFPLAYDTLADKITVKAVQSHEEWREFTDAPVIGEADPWFRITGANDSDGIPLDTYIIENGKNINMDTAYGYGYQTVLINSNASVIEPIFDCADSDNVKVTGIFVNNEPFYAGQTIELTDIETTVDFYVEITDSNGEHTKRYPVCFVKQSKGAKLYVVNPKGDEIRSVFLTQYFESKHDILIANVGDQPLTGLKVELNATNCKLDDYWTIGAGNNTLAPFEYTSSSTEYGELQNLAKIRLVPDGDGEVEGTLVISADDQEPVTIYLSGRAVNPEITTVKLKDAVKWVPYSYLVTTDNMYDWNSLKFKIISGTLPEGMDLNTDTGEIYGAPDETGEFTFTIQADYSYEGFESSQKEFKMTVLDNEDETVFRTSDESYHIIPSEDGDNGYVGEQISAYSFEITSLDEDEIYISNGEYGQFAKLWLNGEVLTEGVDYTTAEGSTRITINSQTLISNDKGRNTIAAEYNVNEKRGDNLKRTAQNFVINLKQETEAPQQTEKPQETEAPQQTEKPQETEAPQQTEKPQETEAPQQTEKPQETEAPQQTERPQETEEPQQTEQLPETDVQDNTENQTNEPESEKAVTCIVYVVDAKGDPIANLSLELHSTPRAAITSADGTAEFKNVDFGSHTLYVKEKSGETAAAKEFEIQAGETLASKDDVVTAKEDDTFVIKVQYADGVLSLEAVHDELESAPKTGDNTNIALWSALLILSACAILGNRKRREHS